MPPQTWPTALKAWSTATTVVDGRTVLAVTAPLCLRRRSPWDCATACHGLAHKIKALPLQSM